MPKRWERERSIAATYMMNMRASTRSGLAALAGDIVLPNKYSLGVRDVFRVCFVYPSDFLLALTDEGFINSAPTFPTVYLMSHRNIWERRLDGHILSDWSLCLYVGGECDINFREFHSLIRLLEVVKAFLVLQRIYQRRILKENTTGILARWPGPERSHGYDGLLEAIDARGGLNDASPCICGSGKQYDRCHKQRLINHLAAKAAASEAA